MNPETCPQGDKLEKALNTKISSRMFMWIVGGMGGSLLLIFASIITLHVAFNHFQIQVVDRIVAVDKNINTQINDIKIEIERLRRYPINGNNQ